jgi:hypothetical protein
MEYIMSETKAGLLAQAKKSIEAGDKKLREAAEALAKAQEEHGATQEEMAEAVGKSQPWVSRLLQWRRQGYKEGSPFGPTTKAERYAHANKSRKKRHVVEKKRGARKSKNKDSGLQLVPKSQALVAQDADDPVEKAKTIIRDWFANMTAAQKTAVVAFVIEVSGVPMGFGKAA